LVLKLVLSRGEKEVNNEPLRVMGIVFDSIVVACFCKFAAHR